MVTWGTSPLIASCLARGNSYTKREADVERLATNQRGEDIKGQEPKRRFLVARANITSALLLGQAIL
jgi:hypothetical protein